MRVPLCSLSVGGAVPVRGAALPALEASPQMLREAGRTWAQLPGAGLLRASRPSAGWEVCSKEGAGRPFLEGAHSGTDMFICIQTF